jgi:predicted DNA-binding protein with PD1-like motif
MNRNGNARGIRVADEVPTGALSRIKGRQKAMEIGSEPASFFEYDASKELLLRLRHDADLVASITELARSKEIAAASFTAIGALKSARLAHYDQRSHEYREIRIDSACELICCTGNVSLKDGKPFAHMHAVLADEIGNTKGGHLLEGIVFAAEVHLRQLKGPKLERKYDKITGLSLWEVR